MKNRTCNELKKEFECDKGINPKWKEKKFGFSEENREGSL
jgi:hypothetical protein